MARFRPGKPPKPIEITKFLGLNESIGETEIILGQSVKQVNFRLTQDYKPQKRPGHNTFINYGNSKDVQGIWEGLIAGKHVLISCNDGKAYEYDLDQTTNETDLAQLITDGVVTHIGTLTDARTTILFFENKLLFWNGTDFKYYDGSTFGDVESIAHVPTVFIATPPAGGGTPLEPINLLTGKKKQEYQGDGAATTYQLAELNINAAAVVCTINGVAKTEGTHFTVNRTQGTVNFSAGTSPHGAPTNGALVILEWTKVDATHAGLVKKNRFAMTFGPGNDTSIFVWGNPDAKNRRSWCASLNPAYWPVAYFTYIGTNDYAITDIKTQNANYQIIFKEDRTHYSYAEYITDTETWDYPVKDLNEKVGNIVFNGVQIVNNNPVSIKGKSWWLWSSTDIEDERNAEIISERLRQSLSSINLSQAVTFDYQSEKEYWCNAGSRVYIWNYGNDTMYTYDNILATCFLDIDGMVYYGSQGTLERLDGLSDNGVAVVAELELGFTDFGYSEYKKNSRMMWVSILPQSKTSVDVNYTTNKTHSSIPKVINVAFNLFDYGRVDYEHWSYLTNRAPQSYSKEIRANDYVYIKFRFKNDKPDETLIILSMKVIAEITSEVR
jgi:hypothetical protein